MNSSKSLYVITITGTFSALIGGALWTLGKVNWFTLALTTVGILLLVIRVIATYKEGKKRKACIAALIYLAIVLAVMYYFYFAFGDFDYTAAAQSK